MSMKEYQVLDDLWTEVITLWEEEKLNSQQVYERLFKDHQLVDMQRTLSEGGDPPKKIFLNNPYGFYLREEDDKWIPFRHGPVNLDD